MSKRLPVLSKLTTLYVPAEDRIRLSGVLNDERVAVIWITQRFMNRLVPALIQWLEKQTADMPRADLLHSVQQERVKVRQQERAKAGEDQPVSPENADLEWLAVTVDVQQRPDQVRLIFKDKAGAEDHCVMLPLQPMLLRQWLNVLLVGYKQAQWPLDAWPEWMTDDESQQPQRPAVQQLH
jgi:hypothetical protein